MGSDYIKIRLPSRISNSSQIFGNKKDKICKTRFGNLSKRDNTAFKERSHRTNSVLQAKFRFLQYTFHHSKKEWEITTCNKSETPQQVSREETFQNGYISQGFKSCKSRRLGFINRSDRCLPSRSYSCQSSQISKIPHKRSKLSVESNVLRPYICTKGLHKDNVGCDGSFTSAKCTNSSLSRRPFDLKSVKKSTAQRQRKMHKSSTFIRFNNKFGKVLIRTKSNNSISRNMLPSRCRLSQTNRRTSSKTKKSNNVNTNRPKSSKRLFTSSRYNSFLCRNNTKCKVIHETNSTTPLGFLETKLPRIREKNPNYKSFTKTSRVVARCKESNKRKVIASRSSSSYNNNRCIKNRLWRSHGFKNNSGRLVRGTKRLAHKSARNGSSCNCAKTLCKHNSRSNSSNSLRQYDSSTVHQQTRRHKVTSVMLQGMGSMELCNRKQHFFESCSCSRQGQCSGRQAKSVQDITHRMDAKQKSNSPNISDLGNSSCRPICIKAKQTDRHLLFMGKRSQCPRNRCSYSVMGEHVRVRVPPNLSDTKSTSVHEEIPLSDNSNSSQLAKETLVSNNARNVDCGTNTAPNHNRSIDTTQIRDLSPRPPNFQIDSMVAINRRFEKRGFSEEAQSLLTASWRKGTQRDYTTKFKKFDSWCRTRQINPYEATLAQTIEFLTDLFASGLQYRTIAGYRSMLSAVLDPIDGVSVGQHPLVCRLIKGIFNTRLPKVKLLPEWDLPRVLSMLEKHPFEPLSKASLKLNTLKTVFLIAITSFRRCGDLQSLRIGEKSVSVQKKGVTFIRHGLAKQDRLSHFGVKVFIPAFKQNKLLDPKRALYYYLKKTENFRKGPDGYDETALFLATKEPHKPVSAQTVSKWIVKVIKMAYDGKISNIKAHSTRAIGPSWAAYNGASMKSILEVADWSKESTFTRFYLRDLDVVPTLIK